MAVSKQQHQCWLVLIEIGQSVKPKLIVWLFIEESLSTSASRSKTDDRHMIHICLKNTSLVPNMTFVILFWNRL